MLVVPRIEWCWKGGLLLTETAAHVAGIHVRGSAELASTVAMIWRRVRGGGGDVELQLGGARRLVPI
jgi:hypothetical protein